MRGQSLEPSRTLEGVVVGPLPEVLGYDDVLVGGPEEDVDGRGRGVRRGLVGNVRSPHGLRRQGAFVDLADLICKLYFRQGVELALDEDSALLVGTRTVGLKGSVVVYKLYLWDFLLRGRRLDERLTFQKATAGSLVAAGHRNGGIGRYVCDLLVLSFLMGE